jgi:hypothetical protein
MALVSRIQQPFVVRPLGEIRVGPIGQQRETDVAFGIGQIVGFELFGLLGNYGSDVSNTGTTTKVRMEAGTPCAS